MTLSGLALESTQLVQALNAFGNAPGHHEHLDAEGEEVTVSGQLAHSSPGPKKTQKGPSKDGKGKGKAISDDQDLADAAAEQLELKKSKAVAGDKHLKNLLRYSTHTISLGEGSSPRTLTSWKMADYAYKKEPCPFPTRARGLFTEQVDGSEEEYRIVARGYDKFFNVGEVSWTKWDTIKDYSSPPYELTLKSNGCIILIAALSSSHILVTSKHSTGEHEMASPGRSHSQMGEAWLEKHLAKVGKTKEELASELFRQNMTAVAELCDDSFEEHVLAYPPELTGLHLHGLNRNTPKLDTLPSSEVTAFAKTWGFIPTVYYSFPSVPAVKTYCERVEKDGGIDGVPVEGFVVRGKNKQKDAGSAFFWKVKYDEPYLLYREWRELTRKVLAAKAKGEEQDVKPGKLKNPESKLYLWWVDREIREHPAEFESWKEGKGIIRTRENFFAWRKTEESRGVAKKLKLQIAEDEARPKGDFDRTLIIPIGIQGCGKTALAVALNELLGWAHTQSDDFIMKKSGPHFIKSAKTLLEQHPVVIADKNNHVRKLRSDLVDMTRTLAGHRVRLVALNWSIDSPILPRDQLHALCASRIVSRGANHQTLRAGEGHEAALWTFLGQYEALDEAMGGADGSFDEVLDMDPRWDRRQALEHVLTRLVPLLGTEKPKEEDVQRALDAAEGYKPKVFKELSDKEKEKIAAGLRTRYYGVQVEADLAKLLAPGFATVKKDDETSLWTELLNAGRIDPSPHVTLVHEAELPALQPLWEHYETLCSPDKKHASAAAVEAADVRVTLGPRLVYDSRAMAIEVSALVETGEGTLKLRDGWKAAHITVGTTRQDVRPIEGKLLLEAVLEGKSESKEGGKIVVRDIVPVTVDGSFKGLR